MDKRLYGLTFAMVLTAGIAAANFPAAAQLGPAMGKKWAETCLSERTKPAYREALERIKLGGSSTSIGEAMVACCRRQNTSDSACKNVEKDQGGRTICEQGLTTCQTIVKADPGVKADLDKAKADKEKADKEKTDKAKADSGQQQQPKLPVLHPQPAGKCSMAEIRSDGTCPPKGVNEDLGKPKPGAPVRTDTVLDTKPIPKKPEVNPKDKIPSPGGCTPGKNDTVSDDAKVGGCTFKTNAGGGRK